MLTFRDHNDALRAQTDWRRYLTGSYSATARGWLEDRAGRYGYEATAPSAVAFTHMREDTVTADCCWMSVEMMDLCQRAMETFDATETFRVADAFIPHGFMVLPEPWSSIDINGKRIAHRAYLWRVDEWGCVILEENDDGIRYTFDRNMESEGKVEPTLRITTLSYVGDEDEIGHPRADEMIGRGFHWGVAHATTIPLRLMSSLRDTKGEGDEQAAWLVFWRVAQKLMSERIITSERQQALRPVRKEAARFGIDQGAPRVIELRRPTEREADPEGERVRDVEWSHRWVVGGHWRQQPYPSLGEGVTKQIWIGSYVKGPDNLPLIVRERVWRWDR